MDREAWYCGSWGLKIWTQLATEPDLWSAAVVSRHFKINEFIIRTTAFKKREWYSCPLQVYQHRLPESITLLLNTVSNFAKMQL